MIRSQIPMPVITTFNRPLHGDSTFTLLRNDRVFRRRMRIVDDDGPPPPYEQPPPYWVNFNIPDDYCLPKEEIVGMDPWKFYLLIILYTK